MNIKHVLDAKRFLHVGMVVRDIEQQMQSLSELWSLGEWSTLEYGAEGEQIVQGTPFNLKVAVNSVGPVAVELLQPVASPDSIWQQYLDQHGEGLHHLAYRVDDLQQSISELEGRGGELLWNISVAPGMNYCYMRVDAGLIVELVDFDFVG